MIAWAREALPTNNSPVFLSDESNERGLALKRIDYRGIVSFCIPADWVDEYHNDCGMFYEDNAERGTLRLALITVEKASNSTDPVGVGDLVAFMKDITKHNSPEVLENGNVLCRFTRAGCEDGEEILVHRWEIGNPVGTTHLRLAIFSFALAAAFSLDPENVRQVAMLDEELPAAHFAPTLGTLQSRRGN